MSKVKICKLFLRNYKQFKKLELDFTNAKGEPVDQVCFIGKNGTGKSTILNYLDRVLGYLTRPNDGLDSLMKIKIGDEYIYRLNSKTYGVLVFFKNNSNLPNSDLYENLKMDFLNDADPGENPFPKWLPSYQSLYFTTDNLPAYMREIIFKGDAGDLLIFSPAETFENKYMRITDVPETNVSNALSYFNDFPYQHFISHDTVSEFWKLLIFLIKKRESEFSIYQELEENQLKTVKQVKEEFDRINPKILNKIARIWNKILLNAGLEFDVAHANNPIQLNENLKAYIIFRSTKQKIHYSELSTGIRNYIFRIGHIYTLFFNRKIDKAFVLIDEPENSLYPDFLFELVETYQEIVKDKEGKNNTQLFISTHSPIIAAQFEPYERIILEWQEDGSVEARKGTAPIGDDPNDVLTQDFELSYLMGKEGRKMWELYLDLKKQLRRTSNQSEKNKLIAEISELGTKYNFEE